MVTSHILAIALSGNRMPLILFLFGCSLLIILIKKIRAVMCLGLVIFVAIFIPILINDNEIKTPYRNFYLQTIQPLFENFSGNQLTLAEKKDVNQYLYVYEEGTIKTYLELKNISNKNPWTVGPEGSDKDFLRTTGHGRIYITAIEMWKENYLFGFGLKSFRVKCWEILPRIEGLSCANHPHNYYLELLSEAGIIGSSLIFVFIIILISSSFSFLIKKKYEKDRNLYFLIPIILIFFLEIWPIKSTGSFFTNWGATMFWLNVALLQANLRKNKN